MAPDEPQAYVGLFVVLFLILPTDESFLTCCLWIFHWLVWLHRIFFCFSSRFWWWNMPGYFLRDSSTSVLLLSNLCSEYYWTERDLLAGIHHDLGGKRTSSHRQALPGDTAFIWQKGHTNHFFFSYTQDRILQCHKPPSDTCAFKVWNTTPCSLEANDFIRMKFFWM